MQRLMGDQSQLDAAKHIGISKSNITRRKDGARAAPDFVVKVARAYNANVLEALVEAEFITEEEANLTTVAPELDLTKVDGALLAEELDRRIRTLNYLKNLQENNTPDLGLGGTVTELSGARRAKKSHDRVPPRPDSEHDGTVRQWDDSTPHAADHSPEEQQLREERGEDPID